MNINHVRRMKNKLSLSQMGFCVCGVIELKWTLVQVNKQINKFHTTEAKWLQENYVSLM